MAPGLHSTAVMDVAISVQESTLTIKGEKRRETIGDEERYHRVERTLGVATATFRNGLLTVRLPKARAARHTTVPIRTE